VDPEIICGIGHWAEDNTAKSNDEAVSDNQFRELDLQWSGNNAALRAWSEPKRFPSLLYLNRVKIIVPGEVLVSEILVPSLY
jgi:hypothetical protein